jgi:CheY-like chemotaxis protein
MLSRSPLHGAAKDAKLKGNPVILVVDDDQAMRLFLRRALESEFDTVEAPDARRALELALSHEPDCILVDLVIPGFSGLEFCQVCSTLRFTQRIPIVIVTGQPAEKYREICLTLGATEYFEKPIAPQELKTFLARLLKNKPKERRTEDRTLLRLVLKLRGVDSSGTTFETVSATEDLSAYGFICSCTAPLDDNALVEVFLKSPGEQWVGRARVARREWTDRYWKRYAFRFVEEPRVWLPADWHTPIA